MPDLTLTQQLTELITTKAVLPTDLERAALLTLDAIANALAGRATDPGAILVRWAGATPDTDAARRAFLWGALTHILETDDLHRASVVHPGCVVVPAAWSVARREGLRGHAMLKAVLWGFEAATRVGMAVGPSHYRIWHNTATCGPYGSAMAVAALLQLEPAQIVHALGNAGTQSSGLWQFLEAGTMTKHLHAGRAAEAGLLAADLARFGFTGPPTILEGAKGWFAATCPDADPGAVTRDPTGLGNCCRHRSSPGLHVGIPIRPLTPLLNCARRSWPALSSKSMSRPIQRLWRFVIDRCRIANTRPSFHCNTVWQPA
jgi:2-methylcitrate dehydratase PrpD